MISKVGKAFCLSTGFPLELVDMELLVCLKMRFCFVFSSQRDMTHHMP